MTLVSIQVNLNKTQMYKKQWQILGKRHKEWDKILDDNDVWFKRVRGLESKALQGLSMMTEKAERMSTDSLLIEVEVKNWKISAKRIEVEYVTSKAIAAK